MKKTFSLLLAFIFVFTLCACGDSGEKKDKTNATLDSYAANGEIPELEVKLGTAIETVKELYPPDYEDADETKVMRSEVEGNTAVCMVTLNASYYYEKAHKDKGVSVIAVTGGNAFGLELCNTTTKSDVTELLKAEYTESTATAGQQYFLPGVSDNCKMLSASFDKIRLDFFFVDDYLAAVTLTNTEYWTD